MSEVVAENIGWFDKFLTGYIEIEKAKRSNPDYYTRSTANSRESVGTNEPRTNVTPVDPANYLGTDIVAPTLSDSRQTSIISGISGTMAALGGLVLLGIGFLIAGARG